MSGGSAPRRIVLCADDYGISPGVNRAIRDLIVHGRLSATSVMAVGPAIGRNEISELQKAAQDGRCAIGLHVTLTAPFHPLTMHFLPQDGGVFWPLSRLLRASFSRRIDSEIVEAEIAAQLAAFAEKFGRMPDYVDGHQHVQIFPQIRAAFLAAVKQAAPHAWVRQCGRPTAQVRRGANAKALLLDMLSRGFRRSCAKQGLRFNPAFSGAYDFARQSDFGAALAGFLNGLPDRSLVMCHPGFVDETLIELDPLTHQREREYALLASDAFPQLLARHGVELATSP